MKKKEFKRNKDTYLFKKKYKQGPSPNNLDRIFLEKTRQLRASELY